MVAAPLISTSLPSMEFFGDLLFYVFALITAGSAIGMVICRNIVRVAVCLLFTLAGVAGLYFLLNAEFLAAVQLVVYVGGTLILIIFGVMLTSTSPFSRFEPKRIEVIISLTLGLLIVFSLTLAIGRSRLAATETTAGSPTLISIGQSLLGDYLLPFELSSVVLLVVLIGAAYLARAGKKPTHEQSAELSEQAKKMS